jgi:hypothetical protein
MESEAYARLAEWVSSSSNDYTPTRADVQELFNIITDYEQELADVDRELEENNGVISLLRRHRDTAEERIDRALKVLTGEETE